jgi:hypothetical protein
MHSGNVLKSLCVVLGALSVAPSGASHLDAQAPAIATGDASRHHGGPLPGVEEINPVASVGHRGFGFLRKPPGSGPFPAIVLIQCGQGSR